MQDSKSQKEDNKLSVSLELQADFYASVLAKSNQENLDIGGIDKTLIAVQALGDESIQYSV
jgi:predicted metalloprotease